MAQYKLHKVLTLPGTPEANAVYFVKEGTTQFKVYVTDSSGVAMEQDVGALKRSLKTIPSTTGYTPIAEDYTDFILVMTGDTAGAEMDVTLDDVAADLNGELIIYSAANHVLNFVAGTGVTLKTTAGNLLKSANDGDSMALIGVKPLELTSTLGVYGTLEFTSAAITEESDPIFTAHAAYGITATDITNWDAKLDMPSVSTATPDNLLGFEAGVEKFVGLHDFLVFNQLYEQKQTLTSGTGAVTVSYGNNTLQPADMTAGRSYRVKVRLGVNNGGNASASYFSLKLRLGGTEIGTLAFTSPAGDTLPVEGEFDVDFNGDVTVHRKGFSSDPNGFVNMASPTVTTIDTSTAKAVDVAYTQDFGDSAVVEIQRIEMTRIG